MLFEQQEKYTLAQQANTAGDSTPLHAQTQQNIPNTLLTFQVYYTS